MSPSPTPPLAPAPIPMQPSLYKQALFAALVAALTPYALYRVVRRGDLPIGFSLGLGEAAFRLSPEDLYDDLFDGEVAAG